MALLNFSISFIAFLLSLVLFSYFPEKTEAIESYFHDVDVNSLLPDSACSRHQTSTGSNTGKHSTTLEVAHMYGPCSTINRNNAKNKPSLADILSRDQSRVDSIQARPQYKDSSLPVHSGLPLNTSNYVVTVGLGTPPQNVTLVFDTGSSLTWTQCKPCTARCYKQRGPVYNPDSSSTYSNISCDSSVCSKLHFNLDCYTGPCVYNIQYGDGSYTVGTVSKESLALTPRDGVFPDFIFGCGRKNIGIFGEASGLLGLGQDPYSSFVHQSASKYGKCFSYCLPSTVSSTGQLAFGSKYCNNSARNVRFTPLIPDPSFYRVEIVAIIVGGTKLPIKPSVFQNPVNIIDSGTVTTRLPPDAYDTMRDAFKKLVRYPTAPAYSSFDTCYYYNIANLSRMIFPTVSFTFSHDVNVELDPSGIIHFINSSVACLAFAGNTDPNDYVIFGNTQMKTIEVVHDVAGMKLGFRPHGCK